MVAHLQNLLKLLLHIGSRKDVGLPAHLFFAQLGLKQAAGSGARQILPDEGINRKHGKSFLGQQDLAAGLLRHLSENGQILPQALFIHHITGGLHPHKAFVH